MRVVLDTNVLVSGLISSSGPPAMVLRLVMAGKIDLLVDARILSEYTDVLSRPKLGFDTQQTGLLLDFFEHTAETVSAAPLIIRLHDKGDEPFAEVAVSGKAQCLITGNVKHFPRNAMSRVKVLTPSAFIKWYRVLGIEY